MKIDLKTLYNLNLRERAIVGLAILLGLGYVIYILIIPPALFHYRTAKRQLFVQKKLIKAREDKSKELLDIERSFHDLEKKAAVSQNKFFSDDQAQDFLKNLTDMAAGAGNDLKAIKPLVTRILCDSRISKEDRKLCYKKDVVEVVMLGGYRGISKHFNELANYKKLLGVEQVELKALEGDELKLKASFILNIYILGEEDEGFF